MLYTLGPDSQQLLSYEQLKCSGGAQAWNYSCNRNKVRVLGLGSIFQDLFPEIILSRKHSGAVSIYSISNKILGRKEVHCPFNRIGC
jgi:hypothetical protein